jgi:hypothetical protein
MAQKTPVRRRRSASSKAKRAAAGSGASHDAVPGMQIAFKGSVSDPVKREELRQELRKLAARYGFTLTGLGTKQEP